MRNNNQKGKKKGIIRNLCSICRVKVNNLNKRYCKKCHNEYMREWRKTHPLKHEQKIKDIIRSKVQMRIRRGILVPEVCEMCGEAKVEAHHDDYSQPYNIRWLCFKHHREHHKNLKDEK